MQIYHAYTQYRLNVVASLVNFQTKPSLAFRNRDTRTWHRVEREAVSMVTISQMAEPAKTPSCQAKIFRATRCILEGEDNPSSLSSL
ncbi:hypothetical protein CEXT_45991 [Caerostris extrusa]|uniref:Uncharacterized protein n=1 Tax=Caerostris extrusa TaxID=172846 RepID=A0AAV4SVW3_CAEEX|nr:hypothetical protein CEXT_45991 [Caerostris extrusa]